MVTSSDNGQHVYSDNSGKIQVLSDYGLSWKPSITSSIDTVYYLTTSSDGKYVYVSEAYKDDFYSNSL